MLCKKQRAKNLAQKDESYVIPMLKTEKENESDVLNEENGNKLLVMEGKIEKFPQVTNYITKLLSFITYSKNS